jgi:hypothetical protein
VIAAQSLQGINDRSQGGLLIGRVIPSLRDAHEGTAQHRSGGVHWQCTGNGFDNTSCNFTDEFSALPLRASTEYKSSARALFLDYCINNDCEASRSVYLRLPSIGSRELPL